VQILNEEGVEIMYDRISLPQEEITVDGVRSKQVLFSLQDELHITHNLLIANAIEIT
jgi:hypothetical protein